MHVRKTVIFWIQNRYSWSVILTFFQQGFWDSWILGNSYFTFITTQKPRFTSICNFYCCLGGDYMVPVGRDEILSRLQGSRQCRKFFKNYILRLHVKGLISALQDPSFVLPGSCLAWTKFPHVIASAHLRWMEKVI